MLVLCPQFNTKLEEIYSCPTSVRFVMGGVNISYKSARYCQHLGGVVLPDAQYKCDALDQTNLCSVCIKSYKSICAPGDMPWYTNKK